MPVKQPLPPSVLRVSQLLCSLSLCHVASALGADSLPGWQGDRKLSWSQADSNLRDDSVLRQARDTHIDPFRVKQVAWEPRAFLYHNFLTDEEAEHLISLAKPQLGESLVTDNDSGSSKKSEARTSSGTFLTQKQQDPIVLRIEDRIADWTFLPPEHGEAIQVLRYQNSQKYDAHVDYFYDKKNINNGGHRYLTVLMYLSDVEEGGETVFPAATVPAGYSKAGLSVCAQRGVAVKPRKGDALLFYSLHLDGTPDDHSLHAGCPVIRGEKWSATKWVHVSSLVAGVGDKSGCRDLEDNCIAWALDGECDKNPGYMMSHCKKSCKKC